MQKKTKIIIGIVAAVVLILGSVFGIEALKTAIRDSVPANYYREAWGIAFPESAKETYSCKTDGRDWWEYCIYTIDVGDDAAFAEYETNALAPETRERLTEILDHVQVPEAQRPNLQKSYPWIRVMQNPPTEYANDNLYVLYDEQTNTVYTFISHK
ncbi:MAG: hypothetical protein ACI4LI_09720 [Candidatus Fimenecus sp.]